jgi:hypothetical protein
MLEIETIYNGPGPFPLKGTFTTDIDGPVLIIFSATAYGSLPNFQLGVQVDIDGEVSVAANVWANEGLSHKALVSGVLATKMTPGTHTYNIFPTSPYTVCDENDFATISMWPLPDLPFTWNFIGPLPQYTTMSSEISGNALVFVHGSAWTDQYPQSLGLIVVVDGNPVLTTQAWANVTSSHQAVPALLAPVALTPGQHQIGISTTTGDFQTDGNDFYTLAVIY